MNQWLLLLVVASGSMEAGTTKSSEQAAVTPSVGDFFHEKPAVAAGREEDVRLQVRGRRLDAFAVAHLDWVSQVCQLSAEQQAGMLQKMNQQLLRQEERWKRNAYRHNLLPDYSPVAFTMIGGAAGFLNREQILLSTEDILSEKQQMLLTVALDERLQSIRQGILAYAVAIVDEELFLTVAQRDSLSVELREAVVDLDDGVFTFNSRHQFLPFSMLRKQLDVLPDPLLTDIQRQKVAEAFELTQRSQMPPQFVINPGDSVEHQVERAAEIIRTRFQNATSLQASWLEHSLGLTPDQVLHLSIAAKGAAMKCTAEWKQYAREHLTAVEKRFINRQLLREEMAVQIGSQLRSLTLNYPVLEKLNQNRLWQGALHKHGATDLSRQRDDFQRNAVIGYLTALLDKELWLTREQRPQLTRLVDSACPSDLDLRVTAGKAFAELSLLTIPLFRVDMHQNPEILTQPQHEVWLGLQDQFQVDGAKVTFRFSQDRALHFELPPAP